MLTLDSAPIGDLRLVRPRNDVDNPVVRKLGSRAPLNRDDQAALIRLTAQTHVVVASTELISEGERPRGAFLIMGGVACRFGMSQDGRREITAFLMAGDLCGPATMPRDNALAALSDCTAAYISEKNLVSLIESHAGIAHALRLDLLVEDAIRRQWLSNRDLRPAAERMAHLFCELLFRLRAVGLAQDDAYDLPITAADLADALDLSVASVSRTFDALERDGFVERARTRLRVVDVRRLRYLAGFRPDYLEPTGGMSDQDARS